MSGDYDEVRDEGEGLSYELGTGESHPTWSPDSCGEYWSEKKQSTNAPGVANELLRNVGFTEVTIREEFICSQHLAEHLGVSEDRIQRLGIVREDFFNVWSVEAFAKKDLKWVRDTESCKRPWFGGCLWPMGEVVLWVNNQVELEKLLEGGPIEGAFEEGEQPKVWLP